MVVGVDGAEWSVIEALWAEGKLPHFAALAERGARVALATAYGVSPVIWTTVATGVTREVHGVTGFVTATPQGTLPISSRTRRVPALWDMASASDRRVAVVGWWATWPAEPVAGVMVGDRSGHGLEDEVFPAEFEATWQAWRREALAAESRFPFSVRGRDAPLALAAQRLVAADFDLVMAYLRAVDVVSHTTWRAWEPEAFPPALPAELARSRADFLAAYEATDEAIGAIVAAAGPATNVMVLSDHGFLAQPEETFRIILDFDRLLERLGYQRRTPDGIDWVGTTLYTYVSPPFEALRRVRFALAGREPGGRVAPADRASLRRTFTADLERVTYANGGRAFGVRDATPGELARGADFVVTVSREHPSRTLHYEDQVWRDIVQGLTRISGTHNPRTPGILVAAGPDVRRDASLAGISIFDIAPTLLYGLGLPVAEDFQGRAWRELFTDSFRRRHRQRSVPTYGTRAERPAAPSAVDQELIEELRALGYLE